MKAYIITLFVVLGTVFTAEAQNKSSRSCDEFKNGHFLVKEGPYGNEFTVKREGDRQIETDVHGASLIFKVKWTDDCSYTLTLEETMNLEKNPTRPDWKEGQIITVNILETNDGGYKQLSSSNFDNVTFMTDMKRVDSQTYDQIMADIGY